MTVRVYRSTDTSAPVLDGTAGSLVNVLDACLVNGYGSKTSSGWTIEYTGSNTRAYRFPSGNQRYMKIDDSSGTNAGIRGYESMSGISTGTGPFPTVAQYADPGLFILKSYLGGSTPIPWIIVATQQFIYLWVSPYAESLATFSYANFYCFGDIQSEVPGDTYNTIINACTSSNSHSTSNATQVATTMTAPIAGHYMARDYLGTAGAIQCAKYADYIRVGQSQYMNYYASQTSRTSFPDPVNELIVVSPVWITEPSIGSSRGTLPGIWCLAQHSGQIMTCITSMNGPQIPLTSGAMNGKVLEEFNCYQSLVYLEVSDTW